MNPRLPSTKKHRLRATSGGGVLAKMVILTKNWSFLLAEGKATVKAAVLCYDSDPLKDDSRERCSL